MTMPAPSPNSPSQLIAALSALMKEHPAYASFIKTARQAVIGQLSENGPHGIILAALENGANTYEDLQAEIGFHRNYLRMNLRQLIRAGLVREEQEMASGNFRPRKLYFLIEKHP